MNVWLISWKFANSGWTSPMNLNVLKTLPLKIRNAVTTMNGVAAPCVFLRNRKHNAFYKVDISNNLEELGFLEAAPAFKQHCDCLPIWPLPDTHYVQVQQALGHFEEQVLAKIITEQQTPELTNRQKPPFVIYRRSSNWISPLTMKSCALSSHWNGLHWDVLKT